MLQIYVFMPHDLNYSKGWNTNLLRDLSKHIIFVANNVVDKF